jgi:hypothetical protein
MSLSIRRLLSVCALAVLIAVMFSTAAEAQDPSRRIEGTWVVQLTFRNCVTGEVIGSGFAMNTFVPGGMMLGTPNGPPAAIRNGHGVWTYLGGTNFANRVGLWAYNPQTGAFRGLQVVTRDIELDAGGDSFTSRDTDQLYDPATFAPIGSPGCTTGVGRRVP